MRILNRCILILVALIASGAGLNASAAYPDKPIQLIVPYPPAGMTDVFARPIGQRLSERLGQPVVIVNRPGAGGTVGAAQVAKANPDGYTLILGTFGSHAVNDALMKLSYNSLKDFTPVIPVAAVPSVMSVLASSPITSVQDLVARARAKPGELTHASTGIGASPQLCIELFKQVAKVDIMDVMYNGGGPALIALLGGQVTMIFDTIGTSIPQIKAGKLRPLGISSDHRSAALPDVPTIAESGYPGFNLVPWFAIWAPAGTPPEIVQKLNQEINAVLKLPDVQERFSSIGAEIMGGSVEDFAAFHRAEYARWAKFIKDTGIKVQ
jgi:tripartite-type tricarboxylate transporter receptor subunit TctC